MRCGTAPASGSAGVGNRVIACERQLHELRSLFDEMRQNDPLRVSYDEASRLVDLGADIDDLDVLWQFHVSRDSLKPARK